MSTKSWSSRVTARWRLPHQSSRVHRHNQSLTMGRADIVSWRAARESRGEGWRWCLSNLGLAKRELQYRWFPEEQPWSIPASIADIECHTARPTQRWLVTLIVQQQQSAHARARVAGEWGREICASVRPHPDAMKMHCVPFNGPLDYRRPSARQQIEQGRRAGLQVLTSLREVWPRWSLARGCQSHLGD